MSLVIGSAPTDPASRRRSRVVLPACCAAVLGILVYLNALDNPFVYDDFPLIVENASVLDASDLQSVIVREMTRPVVSVSYALDTWLWGQRPLGYHVTNLLLHTINVVLVFFVGLLASEDRRRQAGQTTWQETSPTVVGFIAAALLAVHPVMTQAVGYISGRSEVAYSAFFLLAFLAGRRWMLGGGARWWSACAGLWAVAIAAKESAAMLPFLLLAYDRIVLDASAAERRRRFLKLLLPMTVITLVAAVGRIAVLALVEYPGQIGFNWPLALVAVDALSRYLLLLFSPRGQSIFHAVPLVDTLWSANTLAALLFLVALVAFIVRLRTSHSLMALGLIWFVLLLVPSSGLLILGLGEPMAEHRVYLSAAGLFLTWASAFGILWAQPGRRKIAVAGAAVFLAALGFQTVVRNNILEDPIRLSQEAVDLAPRHWMPRILAADALRRSGRCEEAVLQYRAAILIRPVDEYPYTMLARCLINERRLDEAEEALRQLHTVNPRSQDASMGLGVFSLLAGRLDESRAHFQDVLSRDASRAQAS
ncbi:MAG: tetratricopeptide repeat protein [Acidobacteria bacterium]|nr:tetratricopeptide repeat protein [Acidobacteriota bacterium]